MNQQEDFQSIFTSAKMTELFPEHRTDDFFEALLGDAAEGAYDISLAYRTCSGERLNFELQLHQRKGKCLACNLTYGLPTVFIRHPIINLTGLVDKIGELLNGKYQIKDWELGRTQEISRELHIIPLYVNIL